MATFSVCPQFPEIVLCKNNTIHVVFGFLEEFLVVLGE